MWFVETAQDYLFIGFNLVFFNAASVPLDSESKLANHVYFHFSWEKPKILFPAPFILKSSPPFPEFR